MIRALLFDLDGTLWDSEVVRFRSWQRIFEEHGATYSLASYATRLGTIGGRDPFDDLEEQLGEPVDRTRLRERRDALTDRWLADLAPRDGVQEYLRDARALGLAIGVVSTDEREYVLGSLARLGLGDGWDVVRTADRDPARAKPSPALYLEAIDELGISASDAIAFEDSPNGILAATRAGLFCVAVPNAVSAQLDLTRADLVVDGFQQLPLRDIITIAEGRR